MLITLGENAIKHGSAPGPPGGRIDVPARDAGGRLEVSGADTGAGLEGTPVAGTGIGIANIRERLALLYGERAALELEENAPRGFRARIVLPREAPSPSVPFVPVMAAPR